MLIQLIYNSLKKWRTPLQIVLSGLLIYWVFSGIDLNKTISVLLTIRIEWYLLSLLLSTYIVWNQAMRWRDLLMQKDISKIPRMFFLWLTFEGYFFNFFLPSSVGGDVFKALKLGAQGAGKLNAATATFLSRIFGVFILCLFFWIGMLLNPQKINLLLLVLMLVMSTTSLLLVLLLLMQPLKIVSLKKLYTTLEIYRGKWKIFAITLFKTVILQCSILASQYAFFKCIDLEISIFNLFLYVPVINIATMIPLSFNGIGIREWAIIETFATIPGITIESCIASTAIAYTVVFLQAGIGALCHILPVPLAWRTSDENQLRKN